MTAQLTIDVVNFLGRLDVGIFISGFLATGALVLLVALRMEGGERRADQKIGDTFD